jgi:hypothetical protein
MPTLAILSNEPSVVLHHDLDAVTEPQLRDPRPREPGLRLRQRHAQPGDPVVPGGVDQQRAPAAADVEQALALLERELAADQVELALLRGLERVIRGGEVRA